MICSVGLLNQCLDIQFPHTKQRTKKAEQIKNSEPMCFERAARMFSNGTKNSVVKNIAQKNVPARFVFDIC